MGFTDTIKFIIYWKIYQPFVIHISHKDLFDEYNYCLSIEYNHTPSYLLLQQYPKNILHHSYLLNFIPCELYITSTPFCDTTIITYEIDLPQVGKKIGFNLLDDYILQPMI